MKMVKKVIAIILIILLAFAIFSCNAIAIDIDFDKFNTDIDSDVEEPIYSIVSQIVDVVRLVGIGIALIVLVVIGIKYMFSSVGERMELRKSLVPYITGVVIILAAITILSIIQGVANSLTTTTTQQTQTTKEFI